MKISNVIGFLRNNSSRVSFIQSKSVRFRIIGIVVSFSFLILQFAIGCGEDNDTDPLSGTVLDQVTGLRWMKCSMMSGGTLDVSSECDGKSTKYQWEEALNACENLEFAGIDSWRLPNIRELQSIVIYYKSFLPYINTKSFPNTKHDIYWSSTTYNKSDAATNTDAGDYAWVMNFGWSNLFPENKTASTAFVRCVTGP